MTVWHLLFNGNPEIVAHICDEHRRIGQSIACPDTDPETGDCAHVQTKVCDCGVQRECSPCVDLERRN